MQLKNYKKIFSNALSQLYDAQEIDSFFYIISAFLHQMKRIDLALNPTFSIDKKAVEQWNFFTAELLKEKPLQYILGETEFFELRFSVNEHTLIPRPETEELVELIIKKAQNNATGKLKILDIGTGSGCIAISLAKNLATAEVYALDVSKKALELAKKNAAINEVEVNFIEANVLELDSLSNLGTPNSEHATYFDIIVSNPPYVRALEKAEIKKNVLDFEPHLALFVADNDALLFYRKITALAQKSLVENGFLFFEINQYLGKETKDLIVSFGFQNVELLQDVYGNDRMIVGVRI